MIAQQGVADIVEVTDQRRVDAHLVQPVADVRYRLGGFFLVHRDANQLRTGPGQRCHLLRGAFDVGRVGVGHGLNHNRCAAADLHLVAYLDANSLVAILDGRIGHDFSS